MTSRSNSIQKKSAFGELFAPQTLADLNNNILNCALCNIGKPCIDTTAAGSSKAGIVFVGEAPGAKEVETKRPFSGQAGKEFDRLLLDAGLYRDDIYATNIVRARPVDGGKNRTPKDSEVSACLPHVLAEIDILSPRVVVCLGSTACGALMRFEKGFAMTKNRGICKTFGGITYVSTYHPSFVMRSKKMGNSRPYTQTVEDIMLAKKLLESPYVHYTKDGVRKELIFGEKYRGLVYSKEHAQFLKASGFVEKDLPKGVVIVKESEPIQAKMIQNKLGTYFICQELYLKTTNPS